jgi:hypothetical protein
VADPIKEVFEMLRLDRLFDIRDEDVPGGVLLPEPSWLTWSGGTVLALARSIHAKKAYDRLPILADALEEAGCTEGDLLSHLRGPGSHVGGCWALDLLLGKS